MTTSGKPWNAFSSQANLWCRPASQEEGHAREHGKHFGTSGRPGGAASAALDAGGGPVAAGRVDPPYAPWDQPRTTAPRTLLRRAILGLFYLAGLPWAHSPDPAAGRPPKILLLRPDHLGDVLLSFPAMAALHCEFPQSEIVLAVGPWSKEIAGHNEDVTSTITIAFPGFDRTRRGSPLAPYRLLVQTASALRRQEFDLAINLRNDFWWGSLLTYLARIPWRYGYAYPESSRFLTNWLAPKDQHVADQSLMLVRRASADFASSIRGGVASSTCRGEPAARPSELDTNSTYPIFRPWSDEVARARRVLDLNGISAGNRLVVVHPGAGADVKLWTAEGWGAVARYLIDSCGAAVAITGSAGEKALTQEIVAKSGREVVNLAGQLGVGELAAVLATANLAVGVDNGPMHLAAAAGTPTVRLYGPTDVSLFGPRGDAGRHIVIKAGLPCVPCCDLSPRVDPGRGGECMAAIRVDDVIAAIYRLLGEGVCK